MICAHNTILKPYFWRVDDDFAPNRLLILIITPLLFHYKDAF